MPFLDDSERHRRRRALMMQAFTPEALAGYVPLFARIDRRHLDTWLEKRELPWIPALAPLASCRPPSSRA